MKRNDFLENMRPSINKNTKDKVSQICDNQIKRGEMRTINIILGVVIGFGLVLVICGILFGIVPFFSGLAVLAVRGLAGLHVPEK